MGRLLVAQTSAKVRGSLLLPSPPDPCVHLSGTKHKLDLINGVIQLRLRKYE